MRIPISQAFISSGVFFIIKAVLTCIFPDPDQPHQGPTDDLLEDQNGGSVDNQAPDRPQVRPRPRPSQPRKKRKARYVLFAVMVGGLVFDSLIIYLHGQQ